MQTGLSWLYMVVPFSCFEMILLLSKVLLVKLMADQLAMNVHTFYGNGADVSCILSQLYKLNWTHSDTATLSAQVSQLISSRRYFPHIIIHSICYACYMSCTSHRPVRCMIAVPVTTTVVFPASRSNYCCRHPLLNPRLPHRVSLDKRISCTKKPTDRLTDMYVLVR